MAMFSKDKEYDLSTISGDGAWVRWAEEKGFNPIVFGSGNLTNFIPFLPFLKMLMYLRNNSYDIIYVCGVRVSLAVRLCRFLFVGSKIIHGVRWNPSSINRLDLFFVFMEKLSGGLVDGYVTNSKAAKRTLTKRCGITSSKVKTIYNGIDSIPVKMQPLCSRPMEVLIVANLSPRKGHIPFLKVVELVKIKVPDVRFVFVGKDYMGGLFQKKISLPKYRKHINYKGFVSNPSDDYSRARVFVLPSLVNEGCPTSVLEAMSYSIPCVAHNIDGIPELIDHGKTGFLVKKGDYEEMSNLIVTLLRNPELSKKMGICAQEKVKSFFTMEKTFRKHSKLFSEMKNKIDDNFDNERNLDENTVIGFGDEWTRFSQEKLLEEERRKIFSDYFSIFPWELIDKDSKGADIGCGSGRWAIEFSPKVKKLTLIDASKDALNVAKKNLDNFDNVDFEHASVDRLPFQDRSLDFAYSLGVLHHVPDTGGAMQAIAKKMKTGAPFLVYLYYALENRSLLYRFTWRLSELIRFPVSRMPKMLRYFASQVLAMILYWPLTRFALLLERLGFDSRQVPLSCYRDKSFYVMRTDALDRFGTPLEKRFRKDEIKKMMIDAGFEEIRFREEEPFWCAVGIKK